LIATWDSHDLGSPETVHEVRQREREIREGTTDIDPDNSLYKKIVTQDTEWNGTTQSSLAVFNIPVARIIWKVHPASERKHTKMLIEINFKL
jgi:hypothetical protein